MDADDGVLVRDVAGPARSTGERNYRANVDDRAAARLQEKLCELVFQA